ncbi:MAG TPA: hypothetical protein VHC97_04760 [Thermoanaerobaculia bacterium]|nr:hypothetical protein [Thermoanaerobaculia bacterium]
MTPGLRRLSAGRRRVWAPAAVLGVLAVALVAAAPSSAVRVAAFLVAAGYAARVLRRQGPLAADRTARAVLFLVTGVGVFLPALIGFFNLMGHTLARLTDPAAPASRGDLLATTLVAAGLVLAARHWPARLGEPAFVALALVSATALKLAYVLLVRVEPVSDFADMWALTSSLAERGLDATRGSLVFLFHRWSYFERVLPYLLPLRLAFGPRPESYSVANVVVGSLASLLVYRMTRSWFGAGAARVALVVSLAAVETVLAAGIPTHDVPGAFYTLIALVLFLAAWRLHSRGRERAALLAGAGFGLAVAVLDLQRTTGSVMLLTVTLLGLAMAAVERGAAGPPAGERHRRLLAALALVFIPWMVFGTADRVLRAAELRVPPALRERAGWRGLAAATDSWGDGSYAYCYENYTAPYGVSKADWRSLALAKLATDLHHHPGARVTSYLRKSEALFDLGSQTYFYLHGAELRGFGPVYREREERILAVSRWFSALFLGALVVAFCRLWTLPEVPLPGLLPLLYLAVFTAILLFLAEVQPRYLYPIWYLGAIYIGALFGPGCPGSSRSS